MSQKGNFQESIGHEIKHVSIKRWLYHFLKSFTPKCTVSIIITGFQNFQMFLLNVQYNLKIKALKHLMYCTYNRNHRVVNT